MGWNCVTISKLQRLHRWSLKMDTQFYPTLYNGCNYLSMLGLTLTHVSTRRLSIGSNSMHSAHCHWTIFHILFSPWEILWEFKHIVFGCILVIDIWGIWVSWKWIEMNVTRHLWWWVRLVEVVFWNSNLALQLPLTIGNDKRNVAVGRSYRTKTDIQLFLRICRHCSCRFKIKSYIDNSLAMRNAGNANPGCYQPTH